MPKNDKFKVMTNMAVFLTMYMQGVFNLHDHFNLSIFETNSFIGSQVLKGSSLLPFCIPLGYLAILGVKLDC
jgi:hypothetical protein